MQNSNQQQPSQNGQVQNDQSQNDQSQQEQSQKEQAFKKTSPEDMSGAKNAQEDSDADQPPINTMKKDQGHLNKAMGNAADRDQRQNDQGTNKQNDSRQQNKDISKDQGGMGSGRRQDDN